MSLQVGWPGGIGHAIPVFCRPCLRKLACAAWRTSPAFAASAHQATPEGRVQGWIRDQFAAGRGADPEDAARLVLTLASGRADRLSGRRLSVTENLDALLCRIDQIERDDLHTLRLRTGR
jgi:hypothetical protein